MNYITNYMASKKTFKLALMRALHTGLWGALMSFALIPVDLADPKRYFLAVGIGAGTGFIMGLQKFIKGFIGYDRSKK